MEELALAGEFPKATEAEWRALVANALAGAPFETLRTKLYEGFEIGPLHTRSDSARTLPLPRGWCTVARVAGSILTEARDRLHEELDGGATGVSIAFGANLAIQTLDDLGAILDRGTLSRIEEIHLDRAETVAPAALLTALLGERAASMRGSLGFDPLAAVAMSGEIAADRNAIFADAIDAAFYVHQHHLPLVPFCASDRAWHRAGGSAIEELAFTLSAAAAYWRAAFGAGMPMAEAALSIGFALTASADIFLTVAKFRAMRLLWARALAAGGLEADRTPGVIAETSPRMLSERDPHVNILRGTSAAFAAAIGGANAICVEPFASGTAPANSFARRLARNTNLVLFHEAQIGAVADAAAGSHYVETLTGTIAEHAWALFREVEAAGGLAEAFASGLVRDRLSHVRRAREEAVASSNDKITGVTAFPDLDETLDEAQATTRIEDAGLGRTPAMRVLPAAGKGERFAALIAAAQACATLSELEAACRYVKDFLAAPLHAGLRLAEPFERLRQASDRALAAVGSRPPVFLVLLGKREEYEARANFVRGVFAAGGIETVAPDSGFTAAGEAVAAFRDGPAPVACLCASDAAYTSLPGVAAALKQAGAIFVYLAGSGTSLKMLPASDAAAVDRLVFEGCDMARLLAELHRVLRVDELAADSEDEDSGDGIFST